MRDNNKKRGVRPKWLLGIIIAVAALALAIGAYRWLAPGGEDGAPGQTTGTLGIVCIDAESELYRAAIASVREKAEAAGYRVEERDAGGDASRLVTEVKSLCNRGIAALVFFAEDERNAQNAVQATTDKGIPCLSVDVKAEGAAYYGVDHEAMGKALGEALGQSLVNEGKQSKIVAMVRHTPMTYGEQLRLKSAVAAMNPITGYQTEKIVFINGRQSKEETKKQMEYMLEDYEDASGFTVLCLTAAYAEVVAEALQDVNLADGSTVAFFASGDAGAGLVRCESPRCIGISAQEDDTRALADAALAMLSGQTGQDTIIAYQLLE